MYALLLCVTVVALLCHVHSKRTASGGVAVTSANIDMADRLYGGGLTLVYR